MHAANVGHVLSAIDGGWQLELTANQFAQSVHLDFEQYKAEDDWFHLAPGQARTIRLSPRQGTDAAVRPIGTLTHLGNQSGYTLS
jgi:beta-mannosidase